MSPAREVARQPADSGRSPLTLDGVVCSEGGPLVPKAGAEARVVLHAEVILNLDMRLVLAVSLLCWTVVGAQMDPTRPPEGNRSTVSDLDPANMSVFTVDATLDSSASPLNLSLLQRVLSGPPPDQALTPASTPDPSPDNATDADVLPLSVYQTILQQFRTEGLLPAADGLGLTLCGDFPLESGQTPPLWDAPLTVRSCSSCRGQFRAELLREKPMMPRVLLMGEGCDYWPGAQPLPHWSPRPAALLGRLDCRRALLRPELDRLPDLLCLQLDSAAGRSGRLFRRTFALRAVREVGSWSAADGLRITDRRTGVQPNGHIITDGTPLRVAFMQFTSKRYQCLRSPRDNGTCSTVEVFTRMPLFRFVQLELKLLHIAQQYNTTLQFIDTTRMRPLKTRLRLSRSTLRAVALMASGGADHAWPNSGLQTALYRLPVSMVDSRYLVPFTFLTVRRPARLDAAQMLRLFSVPTWAAILISTALVAVLLAVMRCRGSVGIHFSDALPLLLGQSISLGAGWLLPRHRPLVAVWVTMSLILTTAFLSDLIKALTVPRDFPPRTASQLVQQQYRLLTNYVHIKSLYSLSPNQQVRQLAGTMKTTFSPSERSRELLFERSAYTMGLPAVWEAAVDVIRRSNGSVLFEDLNFGDEVFRQMLIGSLWSKHHPLVAQRFAFANRRLASGLTSNTRFEEQARHFGLRAKARACASGQAACYSGGVVQPLTMANLQGPLALFGVGAVLGTLVLLAEMATARLTSRRHQTEEDPDRVVSLGPQQKSAGGERPSTGRGSSGPRGSRAAPGPSGLCRPVSGQAAIPGQIAATGPAEN